MANSNQHFCKDYLVLKPEQASIFDLVRILYSSDIEKRGFIECIEPGNLRAFRRRWLLFVSVLAQKLLLYLEKPMSWTGYIVEMWLNLLSSNGGLGMLLLNLLKGSAAKPERSSAAFRSIIAAIDTRLALDGSISNSDNRYGASLSMMAAKLSYENEAFVEAIVEHRWKMQFLGFFNFWNDYEEKASTTAILFKDNTSNLMVVAFRGTEPFNADQWRTNVDFSWYELQGAGKIHGGFMKALGLQRRTGWPKEIGAPSGTPPFAYYTLREKLRDLTREDEGAKFIVTGHSLGGALAILFGAVLVLHEEAELLERLEGVYTFGQPRVGNEQFGEFMKEKLRLHDVKYMRYVYSNDVVPRLPYDDKTLLFKHFGPCLYFNSRYKGTVLEEEPNKNYFSLLLAIPKSLNAAWELMRSFIIPYIKGPEYKESWALRLLRVVGLVMPGLSAHFPQDYVNATRLGSFSWQVDRQDAAPQQGYKCD
ncbi:triacylglycerol lipase OBL1-like [Diospyros lotus]|uniref:triacylglycerol lipase OBL1-like n=1 Tax=Diospyros lotus TaxID=55363 RepID=UPI00224E0261|nr:triacylglycerol lipase OBL1-like [Diospyros lotus]